MHLAQELLTKVQCSGGSRSFAKETSALKMSSAVADHRKLTMTNWEDHQLPILQLHKKLPKNSALTILWSSGIWSKLEMCKSSKSGCLMNWQLIKKSLFWSVVFSYSIQQQTISQVDCDMWRKVYFIQLALASSVVGPRRSSKAFPKAKLGPKKGHGHCLVVCCPSDPLQLSESITIWVKPLHLRSLLSKLIRCTKTAMPATGIVQQIRPNSFPWKCLTVGWKTNTSKVEQIGLQSFTSSAIVTWFLANRLSLLQASPWVFAGKMLPQPIGGIKCFPRVHQIPKYGFLCYRNKQTYLLVAKMCWLSWFLFWLTKMCLSLVIMI